VSPGRLIPTGRRPVEHLDRVGAGRHAVAAADAARVGLADQPVDPLVGGVHRADHGAGRALAVVAERRVLGDGSALSLGRLASRHADPVHDPPHPSLFGRDFRDVVLHLARGHARPAPRAAVEIDDHAPASVPQPGSGDLFAHPVSLFLTPSR
jgi:hypothetical protein